jgi:hypothetical protein
MSPVLVPSIDFGSGGRHPEVPIFSLSAIAQSYLNSTSVASANTRMVPVTQTENGSIAYLDTGSGRIPPPAADAPRTSSAAPPLPRSPARPRLRPTDPLRGSGSPTRPRSSFRATWEGSPRAPGRRTAQTMRHGGWNA